MEEDKSARELVEEVGNEMRIDNNPDNKISNITKGIKKNPWILVSVILGIVVIVLLYLNFNGGITGNVISEGDAGDTLVEYLNGMTGGGVEYVSTNDLGNLYQVNIEYQSQEIPVFITKDGEYFIQGAVPISGQTDTPTNTDTQPPADVVKSDKPKVELFVMTHCPYGTQAEKGFVPVINLLGDKIDSSVKFVHYFLHDPEYDETPIQICIREELGNEKLNEYLACFLEDGDTDRCIKETNINQATIDSCIENKYDDLYAADSALSEGYGVRGSPTLIINGQQVDSGRSPSAYLATICSAFNDAPEECDEVLSTTNPSPGFGYTASAGGSTNAQC